jgi:hypothetical protein
MMSAAILSVGITAGGFTCRERVNQANARKHSRAITRIISLEFFCIGSLRYYSIYKSFESAVRAFDSDCNSEERKLEFPPELPPPAEACAPLPADTLGAVREVQPVTDMPEKPWMAYAPFEFCVSGRFSSNACGCVFCCAIVTVPFFVFGLKFTAPIMATCP